ncbi:MAG: SpoIIE family protein phosphatase [Cytophagales bacterium]|nr:SpoIIE family protein phosphatase [Cytophagales bacterium]
MVIIFTKSYDGDFVYINKSNKMLKQLKNNHLQKNTSIYITCNNQLHILYLRPQTHITTNLANKFIELLKRKSKGIGIISYPLRVVGYIYAVIVVYAHYHRLNSFETTGIFLIAWLLVYPHLLLLIYKLSGDNRKLGNISLSIDIFIATWVFVEVDFMYMPVFTLFTLTVANMVSVRGVKAALHLPLVVIAGIGFWGLFHEIHFETKGIVLIDVISLVSIFVYFIFYANTINRHILKNKKKSIDTIEEQQEEIKAQNEHLLEKSNQLELAINKLTDSINYAKNIQEAMLPSIEAFNHTFSDGFIFFQPREELSGDFYWFETIGDETIIAAVDCTGHGIPGALMSMIGNDLLTEIVKFRKITQPDKILFELDKSIQKVLRQEETQNRDGMDMALCTFNSKTKKLLFSGSNNPMICISDGEPTFTKGTKAPVGGFLDFGKREYELHEFDLKSKTTVYLYSDGYHDQFGGEKGKKFLSKKLRELLIANHDQPHSVQHEIIDNTMKEWMKDEEQIDDMLIIGIVLN